jgi:hypothetical protein
LVSGQGIRVETRLVVGRVSFCPEIFLYKSLGINDLRAPPARKALQINYLYVKEKKRIKIQKKYP